MDISIIGAFLIAAVVSVVFGKRYVKWLKEHDMEQPIKDEVNDNIYSKKNDDSAKE